MRQRNERRGLEMSSEVMFGGLDAKVDTRRPAGSHHPLHAAPRPHPSDLYRLSQQLDAAPVRPADVYHNVIRVFGDVESPARAKIPRRNALIQYTLVEFNVLAL